MMKTTITLKPKTKLMLLKLKRAKREPFDDVVMRLINNAAIDFEAVLETMEILADKEAMDSLEKSRQEAMAGRLHDIDAI